MNRLRSNVEFWQMILGIAITVFGGVWAVASTATDASNKITSHTLKIDDLEKVSRADHDAITEMRADVKWIRERLSK